MIIIGKTSEPKIKDGFYTALLGDLRISGKKVYVPLYKRVDSYLEYTNITENLLTRLKRVYQGSSDILTYIVKENEIVSISFSDKSIINKPHKLIPKTTKANTPQLRKINTTKPTRTNPPKTIAPKKDKYNKEIVAKNDLIVLGPIIFSDSIEKRKRIHQFSIKSKDIVFEDGFVLLEFNGNLHKYIFVESKEFYQRLNSKNKNSTLELKLKGG